MKPTTIAFINNKGGTAKTKSTEHIGWCIAQAGQPVTLIDDDGQANLTTNMGLQTQSTTLSHVLAGQLPLTDATYHQPPWPANLRLIPADNQLDEIAAEMAIHPLRISRLATALAQYPYTEDLLIIDTPPNIGPLVLAALLAADYVIIPTTPMRESIAGVQRTFRQIADVRTETGKAPTVLGIIATHVQESTVQHQLGLEALEAFGVPLLGSVPHRIGQNAHDQLHAAYQPIAHRILTTITNHPITQ